MALADKVRGWEAGTAAHPHSVLFGPSSTAPVSHVFAVNSNPTVIRAFAMGVNDVVRIELVTVTANGTTYTAPFKVAGCQVAVSACDTVAVLSIPGLYRAVFDGVPGIPYVEFFEAEMLRTLISWNVSANAKVPTECPPPGP